MNQDYPYGVRLKTNGTHYSVRAIADDGTVELQQTCNDPSVDINGKITFPNAINSVPDSYFRNEFQLLNLEQFLEEFPSLKDRFICKQQNPIQGDGET
jgi:hypothetical protein